MNYLDKTGVAYLWGKIKSYIQNRITPISGGGTGANSVADALENLTITNHIVEEYEDDSGQWFIRKYDNGQYVLTSSIVSNVAITNAGGFGYFNYVTFNTPITFNNVLCRVVTCATSYPIAYSIISNSTYPTNNHQISVGVYCSISTTRSVRFNIIIIGY